MASLINTKIKDTYEGLIKTLDNLALSGTAKGITDGAGNPTNITMSTTSTNFPSGTVDFTGATVTGDNNTTYSLGSVQDGSNADIVLTDQLGNTTKSTLVAGTNVTLTNLGNDLTIDAADTNTTYSLGSVQDGLNADIVLTDQLGNTTKSTLVAGTNITLTNVGNDLTITAAGGAAGLIAGTGTDSIISDLTSNSAQASQLGGLAIGSGANAYGGNSNSIGYFAESATFANAFGTYTGANGSYSTAFGSGCSANGDFALSVGKQAVANSPSSISMGEEATVNNGATSTNGIAIGRFAESTALGAVALGAGITAATDNTVTVNLLQIAGYANMNFADDTAAATAGIPLGGVYHTSGALKIRIA